jgi:hypothetical protein
MERHGLFWLLCVCAFTGCVTVSELRGSPPVRSGTVAGSYLRLATCVADNMGRNQAAEGVVYQFSDVTAAKVAHIVATANFPAGLFYTVPAPLLELSFRQADQETVKIEARRSFPGSALELRAWPVIEQCAGKTVAVSPSPS